MNETKDRTYKLYLNIISKDYSISCMFYPQINDRFVGCGEECEPYQFVIKDQEDSFLELVTLAKNKTLSDLYKFIMGTTGCQTFHLLSYKVI